MLLAWRLAWGENRYQYSRMNCVRKWCVCSGIIFFGLYNCELIGCDGSRYALCLSALHL